MTWLCWHGLFFGVEGEESGYAEASLSAEPTYPFLASQSLRPLQQSPHNSAEMWPQSGGIVRAGGLQPPEVAPRTLRVQGSLSPSHWLNSGAKMQA